MTSVIELREYRVKPNKLDDWLAWFESELAPYMISKGMTIVFTSTYMDEEGRSWFVWARRFDDESHRQSLYEQTYNDWWVNEIRPRVFKHIERESVRVRLLDGDICSA